jgi:hypothetical protein
MMIAELAGKDPVINFQKRNLTTTLSEAQQKLYAWIDAYLSRYIEFYKLSLDDVLRMHSRFVSQYSSDLQEFEKTKKYPFELGHSTTPFDRITYDLALLISCLLTSHRFAIMEEVARFEMSGENTLFVGIGTGLEIALLQGRLQAYKAYDLSISDFAKEQNKKTNLVEAEFHGGEAKYSSAFCIELLEHVAEPYELAKAVHQALQKGGVWAVTTAKNIPQSDHVVNFTDEGEFEKKIQSLGFSLELKRVIPHENLFSKVDSNNVYYLFRKVQ